MTLNACAARYAEMWLPKHPVRLRQSANKNLTTDKGLTPRIRSCLAGLHASMVRNSQQPRAPKPQSINRQHESIHLCGSSSRTMKSLAFIPAQGYIARHGTAISSCRDAIAPDASSKPFTRHSNSIVAHCDNKSRRQILAIAVLPRSWQG